MPGNRKLSLKLFVTPLRRQCAGKLLHPQTDLTLTWTNNTLGVALTAPPAGHRT